MTKQLSEMSGYGRVERAVVAQCSNPNVIALLLVLACRTYKDGRCNPSLAQLAEDLHVSIDSVKRYVKQAKADGVLTTTVTQNTSHYRILVSAPVHSPEDEPSVHTCTPVSAAVHSRQGSSALTTSAAVHSGNSTSSSRTSSTVSSTHEASLPGIVVAPKSNALVTDAAFAAFWSSYPRKVGKAEARKALTKALAKTKLDAILDGLAPWAEYWQLRGEPEYVPHAATWLNQERWEDEAPAAPASTKPKYGRGSTQGALERLVLRSQEQPTPTREIGSGNE